MVETVFSVLSGVISIATLIGLIYVAGWRLGRLQLQVDTIWNFIMKRALAEALVTKLVTKNSPIKLTPEAREALQPIAIDLRKLYKAKGKALSLDQFYLEIERQFGDWLIPNLCLKFGLHSGACLILAAELAQEEDETPPC